MHESSEAGVADGVLWGWLDDWVMVPTNSTLTIHKQAVMIHPIIDEYYNHNPSYTRSTGFAVSKGLDITTAEQKEGGAVNGAAE